MAQRCADVDEFVERVKELYELDPARVRFVICLLYTSPSPRDS